MSEEDAYSKEVDASLFVWSISRRGVRDNFGILVGSLGIRSRGWQVSDSTRQVWLSRLGWDMIRVNLEIMGWVVRRKG